MCPLLFSFSFTYEWGYIKFLDRASVNGQDKTSRKLICGNLLADSNIVPRQIKPWQDKHKLNKDYCLLSCDIV